MTIPRDALTRLIQQWRAYAAAERERARTFHGAFPGAYKAIANGLAGMADQHADQLEALVAHASGEDRSGEQCINCEADVSRVPATTYRPLGPRPVGPLCPECCDVIEEPIAIGISHRQEDGKE